MTAGVCLLDAYTSPNPGPRPPKEIPELYGSLALVEIPADLPALKAADMALARDWRSYSREVFEQAFAAGYLVTDFVHEAGRSYYVLTHGEATF
jgi:predicted GNAT superfamily acetyltransferase